MLDYYRSGFRFKSCIWVKCMSAEIQVIVNIQVISVVIKIMPNLVIHF